MNTLLKFIEDHFNLYDLDRAQDHFKERWDFYGLGPFYEHQKTCLLSKTEGELDSLLALKNMIETKLFKMMDKESMTQWTASGFCFNKQKTLILFHER